MNNLQHRARQELKRIRRQELKMGVDEFADLLHVSWHTVKAWEGGQRAVIGPTLLNLWWNNNIQASIVAERIFQAAFEGMFLNERRGAE